MIKGDDLMKKKNIIIAIILLLIVLCYIALIKYVDVKAIGPENTEVGLATINNYFHSLFPYNELFYKISKYLGYLSFLLIGFYAVIGLYQLIKYKSINKVNKTLIVLGCFYIFVLIVYFFFEKVVINYRPVVLDEGLEASFPSSHTMLAICVSLSAILTNSYIKLKNKYKKIFNIGIAILMVLIIISRILSGVHWITDIIGGIIISIFLIYIYYINIKCIKKR